MNDSDFIQWLLQAETPSIRYITLRHLLNRPDGDSEVEAERETMNTTGPIPVILSGQTDTGRWMGERSYYTPKYTSTHWSMLMLTELGADGRNPRIVKGATFMLSAIHDELKTTLERGGHGLSCFWGNLLRYAVHCGQVDHPQIQDILQYLANDAQNGWCCSYNGGLPCAWGAARALWGLVSVLAFRTSSIVDAAIKNGTYFLLENDRLIKANYPIAGQIHRLWFRLNFPLFYQADILFVLRVMAELRALDHPGAGPALEWLVSLRNKRGYWRGSNPFARRTWSVMSDPEETSRWVSLFSGMILQRAGIISLIAGQFFTYTLLCF